MLKYEFVYDDGYGTEVICVEDPYGPLSRYFAGDIVGPRGAQYCIDELQKVVDGKVPHLSTNGNSWYLEIGPEVTHMGDIFATSIELDIPTKWLIELHVAFRDRKRATAAQQGEQG